jgi:hypothetical protein
MGYLPTELALELSVPPGFESAAAFRARLAEALASLEAQASAVHREFLGAARVLAQKPTGRPGGTERRRALNPRVAARDKWKRVEVLTRLVEFLQLYRAAWEARRRGVREAVFPLGTYLLRIAHGVPCAG